MAIAPANRSRRQGNVNLLLPPPRSPLQGLGSCLDTVQRHWEGDGGLAALWKAWPRLAGPQLAPHCRPLRLQGGRLVVGASQPQWLQALRFNKHQLLGALRASGFGVKELVFQQHQPAPLPEAGTAVEAQVWQRHPSRIDVFGLTHCGRCQRPSPAGELQRWGHCSFCQREQMADGPAEPNQPQ
ncbi:MAG: hypothetical protein RLZZ533_52 [Cyanobacteriota bacterium]